MKTNQIFAAICLGMFVGTSHATATGAGGSVSNTAAPNSKLLEILKAPRVSPVTEEVVKLAESGADPAVIQSYVKNSQAAYRLNGDEIIYLHKHGIPDAIVAAMIERGAELSDQTLKSQPTPAPQPPPSPVTTTYATAPTVTTYAVPRPVSTVTYIGSGYLSYDYLKHGYVSHPRYWHSSPWPPYYYSRPCHYSWPAVGFGYSLGGHPHQRGPLLYSRHRGHY